MAPLIKDSNLSFSSHDDIFFDISLLSHDDAFEHQKIVAPLHESTRINTRRRVSFGAKVDIYEVMSRADYSTEELEASWFDRDDMLRMREKSRSEAKLLDSCLLVPGTGVSIRGLESRTRIGRKIAKIRRTNAYAAVFCEIHCQQRLNFYEEELFANAIADSYFTYSKPCAMTAHMIGKRDEIEAMSIYMKPKRQNDW